jgi:hypothetical protein
MALAFPSDVIRGRTVLRPTVRSDLRFIDRLERGLCETTGTRWSITEHERALRHPDNAHFIVEVDGGGAGFVLLAGKSDPQGSVQLLRLLVTEHLMTLYRGAIIAVADLCFAQWFAERLWVNPSTSDDPFVAVLTSVGFATEGNPESSEKAPRQTQVLSMLSAVYWRNAQ